MGYNHSSKNGVFVISRSLTLLVEDGYLVTCIQGAKIGVQSGQEWRDLYWKLPSNNPLVSLLADLVLEKGGSFIVSTPDARAFSGAMREAGKRAFPAFTHTITPYSLRHQFASDMKTAELPADQISRALGHSASKTKGSYGAFGHGRGGMSPDSVEATRQVKQTQNNQFTPTEPAPGFSP